MQSLKEFISCLEDIDNKDIILKMDGFVEEGIIEPLGAGYFSSVFLHKESNKTIKILKDMGTMDFYVHVMDNPDISMPEIHHVSCNYSNTFCIVVSDPYQEMSAIMDDCILETGIYRLSTILSKSLFFMIEEDSDIILKNKIYNCFVDRWQESIGMMRNPYKEDINKSFTHERLRQIFDGIWYAKKFTCKDRKFNLDIKHHNFMVNDGRIIFNDPVWNGQYRMCGF